jgi:hypothetical protein
MSEELGPIEITCDSPPHPIVQACSQLGFVRPEDVRWCRLGQFLADHPGWREVCHTLPWDVEAVNRFLKDNLCRCGEHLPQLGLCLFSPSTGESFIYLLGQCARCRTIFWEESCETRPRSVCAMASHLLGRVLRAIFWKGSWARNATRKAHRWLFVAVALLGFALAGLGYVLALSWLIGAGLFLALMLLLLLVGISPPGRD